MADQKYPHTGWFTQSEEAGCKKEYNYVLCANDPDYVEWHERETRPSALERTQTALIYVARPYLTAIDVTERRNLVYNFRSLLARDTKGHVVAGFYFPIVMDVNNAQMFTIFYQTNKGKMRIKLSFSDFCNSFNSKVWIVSKFYAILDHRFGLTKVTKVYFWISERTPCWNNGCFGGMCETDGFITAGPGRSFGVTRHCHEGLVLLGTAVSHQHQDRNFGRRQLTEDTRPRAKSRTWNHDLHFLC